MTNTKKAKTELILNTFVCKIDSHIYCYTLGMVKAKEFSRFHKIHISIKIFEFFLMVSDEYYQENQGNCEKPTEVKLNEFGTEYCFSGSCRIIQG